jgi:hypothetical protein
VDFPPDSKPKVDYKKDQIHMNTEIVVESGANGFAENKDEARAVRLSRVLPTITSGNVAVLDFRAVRYATQSYVHALIGEALQKYGDRALEHIEFRNCSPQVKSVIELVVDYSLGGFAEKQDA